MDIKSKLPIGVESHTKLDLPFDHATTGMFMLLRPLYYRHCMKLENHHFSFTDVVRPNPLVVPTFGRIRHNLRHFFIPYRLVFPNWEEYKNDVIASNYDGSSQVSGVPQFSANTLYELFFSSAGISSFRLAEIVAQPTDVPQNWDFRESSADKHYKLTRLGASFYQVLYSLGYDLLPKTSSIRFNALALLAYAKAYSDWYTNSSYLNDAIYLKLQQFFKFNDPTTNLELSAQDIYDILLFIRPALYNSNPYFEDAWDNPVSPNSNQFTSFGFTDPTTSGGAYVTTVGNGTPVMFAGESAQIGTKYIHDALQKLSQYQRRHALSGARAIDRVLAEYGIQSDYLKLQRSIYVGVTSQDVDINSIYATANGSNSEGDSVVGDFAGAGFGAGSSQIDFQNDEEGIFITIGTLQPSGGYYQGYDRNNRHLTKTQFFTPEFDALGVQSIEKGEVYVSRDFSFMESTNIDYNSHFGFTGRYGEMKRSINRVSGDFAFPSRIQGGAAWHLMRTFNDEYFNGSLTNVSHSIDFTRGTDAEQYLRLFTYTNYDIDPFNIFLHVDCVTYAPCRPLMDTFDWDSNAPEIHIDASGPKVN